MAGNDSDATKILAEAMQIREQELREARTRPLIVPSLDKLFFGSFEEVHRQFSAPLELVKSLSLSTHDLAITQIHRELRSGRLKALCEDVHVRVGGSLERRSWVELDSWIWRLSLPNAKSDFWETGYFGIDIPEKIGGFGNQGTFELFGVRFGWQRSRSKPEQDAIQSPASPQMPLPKAEAERVAQAILEIWTGAITEARALELAKGMCPENRVSRDPFLEIFRALRGRKKPGKSASHG